MNPLALTEMEAQSLGYNSAAEFDEYYAKAVELDGDLSSLDTKYLTKKAMTSRGIVIVPTSTPVPAPKPVVVPEQRLTAPRKPDSSEQDLVEAQIEKTKKEQEDALARGLGLSEATAQSLRDYTAKTIEIPRDQSGAASVSTPLSWLAGKVGATTLQKALEPQAILSKEQVDTIDKAKADKKATAEWEFTTYYDQNSKEFPGISRDEFLAEARQYTRDYQNYSPLADSLFGINTTKEFIKRKAQTGTGWTPEYKTQYDQEIGENKGEFDPDVGWLTLFSKRDDKGLVETPLFATVRGLVTGEAAVSQAVDSAVTGQSFSEGLAERVAAGDGLEKGFQEAAEYFGAEPEGTASTLAWWTGLGAGLLVPLDLGIGDLTKAGLKAGIKTVEGVRELSSLKKVLALGDNVVRDIKNADPHILDLRTQIVRNADLIPEVNDVAKVISHVSDDIVSAKNADEVEVSLREAAKAAGIPFDDFIAKSKGLGLNDITGFTGTVERKLHPTKMPIGDTGLAWRRVLADSRAAAKATYGNTPGTYALRRVIARDIVKHRIDGAVAKGVLPSTDLIMITPTVALKPDRVIGFLEELKSKPVPNLLHTKAESAGPIVFTEAEIKTISDSVPKSIYRNTPLADGIDELRKTGATSDLPVSRAQLNSLIDDTVAFYAQKEATGQAVTTMSTTAANAQQVLRNPAAPRIAKLNAAVTKLRLEEAFTPAFVRPTGFTKVWRETISPLLAVDLPEKWQRTISTPLESFARSSFVQKLGAIPERFEADWKAAKASGVPSEDCFAEAIVKPFVDSNDMEGLWANYFAALYGGYDTVAELKVLRSGNHADELLPKVELVSTFRQAYRLADEPMHEGEALIVVLARQFKEAPTNTEKVKLLGVISKLLEGRALGTFISRKSVAQAVSFPGAGAVAHLKPVFNSNNMVIPLQAAYIQQQQLRIMTDINRELFNTAGTFSPKGIEASIKWGDDYINDALKAFPDLTDEQKALFADFAKKDFLYSMTGRISTTNPQHVEDLYQALLPTVSGGKVRSPDYYKRIINPLGYIQGDHGFFRTGAPSVGNIITNTLMGQTAVPLTHEELRAWAKSIKAQSDIASADITKAIPTELSAHSLLPSNGFYPMEELQRVLSNSASLETTENAFRAFDYLKTRLSFPKLSDDDVVDLVYLGQSTTHDFATKFNTAVGSLNARDMDGMEASIKMMLQQMSSVAYAEGSEFLTSNLPGFIKNNLLGGGWLPNPVYHMQNFLSGPMLMHVNLNRPWSLTKPGTWPVLAFFGDYWNTFKPLAKFDTPSGRSYTAGEVEVLIKQGGVESSSYSAEVSKSMLKDMIRYAGKTFSGEQASRAKLVLRKIASYLGADGNLSYWNEFAQWMDLAYRRRAMVQALQAGESETQAIQTARRALFDYEDLTTTERDYVAKWLWFYRFMRQNIVQTTVAFIDNPTKVARLAKVSKLDIPKAASRLFGDGEVDPDTTRYKDSKAFIALVAGQDKERYAIYSPSIPVLEATAGLLDSMAFFAVTSSIATGSLGFNEYPDKMSRDAAIENFITRFNLNPVATAAELGLLRTFGLNINLNDKENISYLDPKFVAWAKATGQWNTLNAYLNIEVEANDPRNGITTFDGYYYKLQDDSKMRWQLMMEALKTVGLQRTMRDYTTILANSPWSPEGMSPGTDISTTPEQDFLKSIGIISISAQPSEEEAQSTLRKQKIQQLRGN